MRGCAGVPWTRCGGSESNLLYTGLVAALFAGRPSLAVLLLPYGAIIAIQIRYWNWLSVDCAWSVFTPMDAQFAGTDMY